MSFPKELVECLITIHLLNYQDWELIVLKGHLLLEVFLVDDDEDRKISFYSKVKKLEKRIGSSILTNSLFGINKIRNELAHKWNFEKKESGLLEWADNILDQIESSIKFRRTPRMRIIHAFGCLGRELMKVNDNKA